MFSNQAVQFEAALATVSDNRDPDKRGRIRVTCVAIIGDESRALPGWIDSAAPWGWFIIPDVGQQVTIFYTTGTSTDTVRGQSSISSMNAQWFGATHYTDDNAEEDPNPVPQEFTSKNYGKRRGFKTPAGHVVMFDDTNSDREIQLSWVGGTKAQPQNSTLTFTKSGVQIEDQFGNSIQFGSDGIVITPNAGGITFTGAMRYQDTLGIKTNIGEAIALMNSQTPAGATLKATVSGAVPADGTALLAGIDVGAQL